MQRAPLVARQRERIAAGLPFVESLARRVAASMPHSIELSDLVQDGMLGLIDAARRFDEDRGIKFETFAERRVRGAMIDALRRDAWPRGVRRQRRELEAAREQLRRELGAEPSLADLAARMGSDEARLGRTILRISTIESTSPLSAGENVDGAMLPPALVPSEPPAPDKAYEEREVRDRVRAAIASLPPRERKVIGLYYYAEATMKEIGASIGVNESRVSQLHARAVQRLRQALGADCSAADAAAVLRPAILAFQQGAGRARMAKAELPGAGVVLPVQGTGEAGQARGAQAGSRRRAKRWRQRASGRAGTTLSDHFAGGAQQISETERFGEPAAAAVIEEPFRIRPGDVAGHEENAPRHRRIQRLQLSIERGAVEARHLQVADDQIERALLDAVERLESIARAFDGESGIAQRFGHGRARAPLRLRRPARQRRRRPWLAARATRDRRRLHRSVCPPAARRRTTRPSPVPTST